jgi:hypothetical protein
MPVRVRLFHTILLQHQDYISGHYLVTFRVTQYVELPIYENGNLRICIGGMKKGPVIACEMESYELKAPRTEV